MKIRMTTVGKYSYDGKNVIVRKKGQICETIPDKTEEIKADQVHSGVAKQWLSMGICKEVKPRVKK